jgi:hypothetical protein
VFFGKVIASRYFLPLLVFLIPLGALSWEQLLKRRKDWAGLVGLTIVAQALYFGVPLITQPSTTPFASEDVEQYLTEWSAGYGNAEVRDLIQMKASQGKVVVATEGYFGTLPDGLLMYFDRSPLIDNVEIFGIGQPIRMLPELVGEKAKSMDTYVLVNEHRLLFDPSGCCELVARYPRPRNGPALLLFKVEATDAGV